MKALIGLVVPFMLLACTPANRQETAVTPPEIAPARDGDIAIREELDAARKAGTRSAFDLFIARHPGHKLADTARIERAELPD